MKHTLALSSLWRRLVLVTFAWLASGVLVASPASGAPAKQRSSSRVASEQPPGSARAGSSRSRARARTAAARKRAKARRTSKAGRTSKASRTPKGSGRTRALATVDPEARSAAPSGGAGAPADDSVAVEVVEVAGGRAYLTPGGARQVRIGHRVRIGGRRYSVIAVNAKNIVVNVGNGRLSPGQRGEVTVQLVEAQTFATRPVPRPLAAFAGRWPAPELPADAQTVRFVPLGAMADDRKNRAAFVVDYQRIQPLSGEAFGIGRTRLRALLHAELSNVPLYLDADAIAEFWQAGDLEQRPKNASRPFISVRQLELGYRGDVLQGSLGRLRYASRTLGSLDGARVSASLGEAWNLAAFGGTLADPLDGSVSTDASRFGAELGWRDASAAWQPRGSLTVQGSRFLGQLDERRITGLFESFPSFGRLGARAEVSLFDADNPWGASTTELTAAGADASIRFDALRLGAALDMRRPERSLWLASFLPRGYFCVAEPAPAAAIEPCQGGDRRYAAALNAAWEATLWTADAGATLATTRRAKADQATGFINFRRRDLIGKLRLDAGGTLSRGSLYQSAAVNIAPGMPLGDESADISLYYRPSWMRYRAELDGFVEHGFGTRLWWALSPVLDVSGSADALVGRDVDVLMFQLSVAYRPRF